MALSTLSNPVLEDEDERNFWVMFATHQAVLQRRRMQEQSVLAEIDELEAEQKRSQRRRNRLVLAAARLCSRERHVWAYPRAKSWYETTLPYFPESTFRQNFRVDRSTFRYIVSVCECMRRNDTNMRQAIPLEKRVAIGLYRLATSAEDRTVANLFGVSRSSVNIIFREFCTVLLKRIEPRFVKFPQAHDLAEHMLQFAAIAGFPQGVGALDGCHLEVCPPKEYASDYHNYKGWYSTILLAVADHAYRFLYTNVGSPGRNHDAAVFRRSRLPGVLAGDLFRSEAKTFEGVSVGPVLLADQAFPLQCHIMKPFPQSGAAGSPTQAFNYRLSSARRVVENAFGRLKARFRILHKGLESDIDSVNNIVRACCVLHNICEQLNDGCDKSWLDTVRSDDKSRPQPVRFSSREEPSGVAVRDALAKYFAAN
ncbi:protein ANTAGONIST OF LIKE HETEROCHROMATIN PROTEIN 1 [Ixodes scapularis]